MKKIQKSEHPRWYDGYISLVPEGDIVYLMEENMKYILATFKSVSERNSNYKYAEGKWSIKELLGHIIDTERVMSYRILRFSRGDKTDIKQYDHDMYVANANFEQIPLKALIQEYRTLKFGNILFYKTITPKQKMLVGTVDEKEFTVRAIMHIIVGHEIHHMNVLKEKYLPNLKKN